MKWTKKVDFTTMVPKIELFWITFLGEWKTPKRHFEINLTLVKITDTQENTLLWVQKRPQILWLPGQAVAAQTKENFSLQSVLVLIGLLLEQ